MELVLLPLVQQLLPRALFSFKSNKLLLSHMVAHPALSASSTPPSLTPRPTQPTKKPNACAPLPRPASCACSVLPSGDVDPHLPPHRGPPVRSAGHEHPLPPRHRGHHCGQLPADDCQVGRQLQPVGQLASSLAARSPQHAAASSTWQPAARGSQQLGSDRSSSCLPPPPQQLLLAAAVFCALYIFWQLHACQAAISRPDAAPMASVDSRSLVEKCSRSCNKPCRKAFLPTDHHWLAPAIGNAAATR